MGDWSSHRGPQYLARRRHPCHPVNSDRMDGKQQKLQSGRSRPQTQCDQHRLPRGRAGSREGTAMVTTRGRPHVFLHVAVGPPLCVRGRGQSGAG